MSYKFANSTCVVHFDGRRLQTEVDQIWAADDEFVKARPDLFNDAPSHVNTIAPVVEQATAAPGEKRATKRAAK